MRSDWRHSRGSTPNIRQFEPERDKWDNRRSGADFGGFLHDFPLPVFDPTHTGIFGMVWGAVRYLIARMIFTVVGFPLVVGLVGLYRALFFVATFVGMVAFFSGFYYPGEFHGWSPVAAFKGMVNGAHHLKPGFVLARDGVTCVVGGWHCDSWTTDKPNPALDESELIFPGYPCLDKDCTLTNAQRAAKAGAERRASDERARQAAAKAAAIDANSLMLASENHAVQVALIGDIAHDRYKWRLQRAPLPCVRATGAAAVDEATQLAGTSTDNRTLNMFNIMQGSAMLNKALQEYDAAALHELEDRAGLTCTSTVCSCRRAAAELHGPTKLGHARMALGK